MCTPGYPSMAAARALLGIGRCTPRAALPLAAGRAPATVPATVPAPASYASVPGRAAGADAGTVELVYDLHRPAKPLYDDKTQPILFLHGLFGSKKNNRTISKTLAGDLGRSIYALDLRNHGASPHAPRHDYLAMAGDVANFIQEHGLKDTTIIGHSMGAKTAMTLALQTPDLVANLVAVDNAPIDAAIGSAFARYVRGMKEIDRKHVTRQSEADKILQPYEPELTVRHFLLGNTHHVQLPAGADAGGGRRVLQFRIPLDILARSLDTLGDFPFKDPQAVRFEKPALFVRGTQSKYVPDEALPVIGQFFPRFELADIDAGHWVISEKPEAFRQAVVRFLAPKD